MSQVFMDCPTTRKPMYFGINMEWNQLEAFEPVATDPNIFPHCELSKTSTFAPTVAASFSVSIGNLKQLLECSIPKGGGQHPASSETSSLSPIAPTVAACYDHCRPSEPGLTNRR